MGAEDEGNKGVFWGLLETVVGSSSRAAAVVRTVFGVESTEQSLNNYDSDDNDDDDKMDTLNTLLIGWIIFSLFVIFLGTFFYETIIKGPLFKTAVTEENVAKSVGSDVGGAISDSGGSVSKGAPTIINEPSAAIPTIVPQEVPESVAAPVAAGADPDAVVWVNKVLNTLYDAVKPQSSIFIRDVWATGLNDYTVTSALDV
ncbi:unnamed protein product, partial [Meganyctiphanes norvegica]